MVRFLMRLPTSVLPPRWLPRFALIDLLSRPLPVVLTVVVVAFFISIHLMFGAFGVRIYKTQEAAVLDAGLTEIEVIIGQNTPRDKQIDAETMARFRQIPGVVLGTEKVDLTVHASAGGRRSEQLLAEGTFPGDPRTTGNRLASGRGISGDSAHEVVLSQAAFDKLASAAGGTGKPDTITIEVTRTFDEVAQTQSLTMKVVGVLKKEHGAAAFMPVGLLRKLSLWCMGRIEGGVNGEPGTAAGYPGVIAFGPASVSARLADELTPLRLRATNGPAINVFASDEPLWLTVSRGGAAAEATEVRKVAGSFGASVRVARVLAITHEGKPVRVAALPNDDPRWQAAPGGKAPAFRRLFRLGDATLPVSTGVTAETRADLPVVADFVGTTETLQWLTFTPEHAAKEVRPLTMVRTTDPAAARELDRLYEGHVVAEPRVSWELAEIQADDTGFAFPATADRVNVEKSAAEEYLADIKRRVRSEVGLAFTGRMMISTPGDTPQVFTARFVPAELFTALTSGRTAPQKTIGFVRVGPRAKIPNEFSVGGRPFRALAEVAGQTPELWFAESELPGIDPEAKPAAVASWGEWPAAVELPARGRWRVRPVAAGKPEAFSLLLQLPDDAVVKQLGPVASKCQRQSLDSLRAQVRVGNRVIATTVVADPEVSPGTVRVPALVDGQANIHVGSDTMGTFTLRAGSTPHPTVAAVHPEVLRLLTFYSWRVHAGANPGEPDVIVAVPPTAFDGFLAACKGAGLTVENRRQPEREKWLTYRLEPTEAGKSVMPSAITALNMARPTIAVALPDVTVAATLGGKPVRLTGSAPHDPRRFAVGLTRGSWLGESGLDLAVLPAALLAAELPGVSASEWVGKTVNVRVTRQHATAGIEPPLTLPVKVAGVTQGDDGYVPFALVEQVRKWQQGKAVFDQNRGGFVSPLELAEKEGLPRATLFAESPEAVPGITARLRAEGFDCSDRLAEQEGLRKLGRLLLGVIAAVAGAFLFLAALAVYTTSTLTIEGKRAEIGLLKAHGLTRREILGVSACQGLMMAAVACVLGLVVAAVSTPVMGNVLRTAFNLSPDVVSGSLFSAPGWLFVTAAGLAVVVGLVGAVHPALRVIRSTPLETMR